MSRKYQHIIKGIDSGRMVITGKSCTGDRWPEGDHLFVVDDYDEQKTIHVPVEDIDIIYVEADTVNGVVEEDDPTEYCADAVSQDTFYDSLKDLGDDKLIGSYVTRAMYDKIKSEYGVRS